MNILMISCQNDMFCSIQINENNILDLKSNNQMYCINHRVGILYRENLAKKSYQLRYFFIDNEANLFYVSNLPKIQKVIRLSKDMKQIKSKLIILGERCLDLKKYNITAPKAYSSEAVIPFSNRTCIEIKEKQAKNDQKMYQIFGFMEEDTVLIYQQINHLTGKQKKSPRKRKSVIQQEKEKQQKDTQKVFENFINKKQLFYMPKQQTEGNQYEGEKVGKVAQGKGKQMIISEGTTFTGHFKDGKKHGSGYLVNQNLDTLQCDFLNDELAGI